MPPPPGKLGDVFVWLVTVVLFISILAGGTLLVLYITLPESETTVAFPAVGMVLVGLPWLFWIMTCFYRSITLRGQSVDQHSPIQVVPTKGNAGGTSTGGNTPVDSPGGKRKVHFSMDNDQEHGGAAAEGKMQDSEEDGGLHISTGDDSSSSRESEVPFARSMS